GVHRGEVVIHRPYSLDVNQNDINREQERYEKLNAEIAAYLRDMNVPVSLLDAMLTIPPERGKTLSREELQKYHLDQNDPVWQQMFNAQMAKRRGLSMAEFLRRRRLEEQCEDRHYDAGKTYVPYYCYEVMKT